MTKLDEIKQRVTELRAEARIINDNPNSTFEEIQTAQNKLKVEIEKLKTEELLAQNKVIPQGQKHEKTANDEKYKKAFYNMMRNKITSEEIEALKAYNKLSSATGADGGFLIPNDQMTKIIELKKERFSFRNFINVEPVSTKTGTRVIEKNADEVPFVNLEEDGISACLTLMKSNKTVENNLYRSLNTSFSIKRMEPDQAFQLSQLDDLKKIRNTKLNMAFKATTKFFMNSDAFNYFAEEKDANGRSMLERDPKNPTQRIIDGCPVIEIPNDVMKTVANKAKVIIGDLKEFLTLFDREQLSIMTTQVGGDAWKKNNTEIRAILREDLQKVDERAIQIAEVDISVPAPTSIVNTKIGNISEINAMIEKAVADAIAQQTVSLTAEPELVSEPKKAGK